MSQKALDARRHAAVNTALEKAVAQQAALDNVPSISELVASQYIHVVVTATNSYPIFVAPFGLKIVQASLTVWGAGFAADNTNYWTIDVRRLRAAAAAIIVSKTTRISDGQAVAQRTEWHFDTSSWSQSNAEFQKGDICAIAFTLTGVATAINVNLPVVTVRYEPL